jgi:hypothetical protein
MKPSSTVIAFALAAAAAAQTQDLDDKPDTGLRPAGAAGVWVPPEPTTPAPSPAGSTIPRPIPLGTVTWSDADGVIWAAGDSYKARFSPGGVQFVPFLGSDAERSWPLGLRLVEARCGDCVLPFRPARVSRDGTRVTLDHGALLEQYDVSATGIEQRFVLRQAPQGGDLVLRVDTATDLVAADEAGGGFRFSCGLGGVTYSRAVVFDDAESTEPAPASLADGAIALRVPAAFLARAQGTVTIDPVITTFLVHGPLPPYDIWLRPDVAHGEMSQGGAFSYERAYSVNDHDVYSVLCDAQGMLLPGTGVWIDVSSDYWTKPRIAYLATGRQYLVVAERAPYGNGNPREIRGRARGSAGTGTGAELVVSGGEFGNKVDPVVGGDPNPNGGRWCVVWQRNYSDTDTDIHYAMVDAFGGIDGTHAIDNSGSTIHYQPSISRSNGSHYEVLQRWNVVFQDQVALGDIDVWFARISRDGSIYVSSQYLDTHQAPDYNAVASTATEGDLWLACFERLLPNGDLNIVAKLMGNTGFASGEVDITVLTSTYPQNQQRRPRVDSDGCRFAVAYEERVNGNDFDLRVSTLHPQPAAAGYSLGVSERWRPVATANDPELDIQLSSAWGANWSIGPARVPQGRTRYLMVWSHGSAIEGGVYEGRGGSGTWTALQTGCGVLMGSSGVPSLGAMITVSLLNPGPTHGIILGLPLATPVPLCGTCSLGFDPAVSAVYSVTELTLQIPCNPGLLNARFAFQGFELYPGTCLGFRLSNTLIAQLD